MLLHVLPVPRSFICLTSCGCVLRQDSNEAPIPTMIEHTHGGAIPRSWPVAQVIRSIQRCARTDYARPQATSYVRLRGLHSDTCRGRQRDQQTEPERH